MALSIITNPTAIGAINSVNNANSLLSNTIKQLSTGLRINSAADDASGLAVSEKLRGQISGLAKAAANAQDAISMLQTAEGAMGSMTDIVQRMRELAVQAGDPAYTTNDRAMLQLEMDQLKEEINRISSSTEFNTKKLLNGDAAALWSATSGEIEAIVKGTPAEGNYKLEYSVDPGDNAVYKTDVMTVKEGAYSFDMTANATLIRDIDNFKNVVATGDTAMSIRVAHNSAQITHTTDHVIGSTFSGITAVTVNGASGINTSFTLEVEALASASADGTAAAQFRVRNVNTGALSDWIDGTIKGGTLFATNTAALTNLVGTTGSVFNSSGVTLAGLDTAGFNDGDRVLVSFTASAAITANSVGIQFGSSGATAIFANANELYNQNQELTTTVYTAQMDEAGNISYGSIDVTMGKADPAKLSANMTTVASAKVTILGGGDVASKYTKLGDIARFVNSDGRNVLDNTQELTVYNGIGESTSITMEASDTIEDFEEKLTNALIELGLGADATNSNATTVNRNLVNFVSDPVENSNEAVKGTFIIQGALLGEKGNISFSGDQGVIDALSVAQIQESTDSALTVRVSDAHSGEFIGEDTVTDGRLRNIIKGVDVEINPASAANITYDDAARKMVISPKTTSTVEYLHVVDNATRAAIGANEGQVLDLSIAQLDTKSLEIEDVNVVTFDNAQKSITKLDQALEKISEARAITGAQINRLDYTINNLNTTRENLVASESRIRDLDIAQASADLVARQVLLQSATAMLAQANQLPTYAAQLLR